MADAPGSRRAYDGTRRVGMVKVETVKTARSRSAPPGRRMSCGRIPLECAVRRLDMTSRFTQRTRGARLLLLAAVGAAALGMSACSTKTEGAAKLPGPVGNPANCPWLNPHLPIARRVALIMRKMTLADEIGIVEGHGMHPYVGDIKENAALCLPRIGLEDGPNGVGDGMTGVTQLPSGAALAATFSRTLAYQYGQVIGAEQAAKGSSVDLGPTVNIDRDPRWGREFESLSEDPRLAGEIAAAEIRGIQREGTIAQVKHFDAYNQET
ncbi:MAG: hypothetical protein M0Z28_00005, partial [Rhodospirillales bacterium]|nr:hypothetical protein [Rhodospirillales bacterium]